MTTSPFAPDYATAKERFLQAANAAGASLEALPLEARGPVGEPLAIDAAWLGAERPKRVLLHTSGLHGVEGFAGSAIQLELLQRRFAVPDGTAAAFLHVLNPYGMAWLRRFNENNVDLNRNFLGPDEEFRGAADAYRMLNPLLNPPAPPRRFELFLPQALWRIARYGFQNLKQAVAQGQYEFPQGVFFGGARYEATTRAVLDWAKRRLGGVERVFVIDVHTGLGRWGEDSLLTHYDPASEKGRQVASQFGPRVQSWHRTGVAYQIRGGFLDALERELAQADVTCICQEFGTYRPLKVLHALCEENRLHHWGDPRQLTHPAKRRLVEAFCPAAPSWRRRVLDRGSELFDQAFERLAQRSNGVLE